MRFLISLLGGSLLGFLKPVGFFLGGWFIARQQQQKQQAEAMNRAYEKEAMVREEINALSNSDLRNSDNW